MVEGTAELINDLGTLGVILALENSKYATAYTMELFDPAVNACFRVLPSWAFGAAEGQFASSPTRWTFQRGSAVGC